MLNHILLKFKKTILSPLYQEKHKCLAKLRRKRYMSIIAFLHTKHIPTIFPSNKLWIYCGQVMHVRITKLTIIGSDNRWSPDWHQAIIWTNVGILLIKPFRTKFSEHFIKILMFSFKEMHLKMLSVTWQPFCLSLNLLKEKLNWTNWASTNPSHKALHPSSEIGWKLCDESPWSLTGGIKLFLSQVCIFLAILVIQSCCFLMNRQWSLQYPNITAGVISKDHDKQKCLFNRLLPVIITQFERCNSLVE